MPKNRGEQDQGWQLITSADIQPEWMQGQKQNCHLGPQFQETNHMWPRRCHERLFLGLPSDFFIVFFDWLLLDVQNNKKPGKITGHRFKYNKICL